MHLFSKRPLCFFCFLFLLVSVLANFLNNDSVFWILFSVMMLISVSFLALLAIKKLRVKILYIIFSLLFVFLALANTNFRINEKIREAEKYTGKHNVSMLILSEEYSSEYTVEYKVKIKAVDGEETDIKATAICPLDICAEPFDTLYADAMLKCADGYGAADVYKSDGILLTTVVNESDLICHMKAEGNFADKSLSFGLDGIRIALNEISESISAHLNNIFIGEAGGLSAGLLMNDKSNISPDIIRDFRRAGTSHLLAVSGLHISLLLGFIDLILRKVFIHKNIRCCVLAFFAVALLALAGFSMSACRAVFMLFFMYFNYMFLEENDSVTSLFFAVFVIILISPFSVYDLGLWMSFFATLGIVSVFPVFHKFVSSFFYTSLPKNFFFKSLLLIIEAAAITVIANIFLLPVMWYFFGELSLVSLPVNIIVSPIVSIMLPLIAIGACIFFVPVFGSAVAFAVERFTDLLLWLIRGFSHMDMATVSLKYDFVTFIMIGFTVVMVIFMIAELKNKWMLVLPPAVATVSFVLCFLIYNNMHPTEIFYYSSNKDNIFVAVEHGRASVVDISDGNIETYIDVWDEANARSAVMIDSFVLTHFHRSHISGLEYMMTRNIVKTLYVPVPESREDRKMCDSLQVIAADCGTEIVYFDSSEKIELGENIYTVISSYKVGECSVKGDIFYGNKKISYLKHGENTENGAEDAVIGGSHVSQKKYSTLTYEEKRYRISDRFPINIHELIK